MALGAYNPNKNLGFTKDDLYGMVRLNLENTRMNLQGIGQSPIPQANLGTALSGLKLATKGFKYNIGSK